MNTPYWSKAPIDATHYGTDTPNWWEGWYKLENGEWFVYWDGSDGTEKGWCEAAANLKSWPERESSLIPRPTQWRGPQDGLPPVGVTCEAKSNQGWRAGIVKAHTNDRHGRYAIVQHDDVWSYYSSVELRPIQSDRDRAIEQMRHIAESAADKIQHIDADASSIEKERAIMGALYDAGYRKP